MRRVKACRPSERFPFIGYGTLGLLLATAVAGAGEPTAESLAVYRPELTPEMATLLRAADPAKGEDVFMRKCSACHDARKEGGNGKGPLLWNLLGRQAGTLSGFEYSPAMRGSGHTWTLATLNYYLTQTSRAVPGLAMNFRGIRSDAERADLIAFLRLKNDNPPPLP